MPPQINSEAEAKTAYGVDAINQAAGNDSARIESALISADSEVLGALLAAGYSISDAIASPEAKRFHLWIFFYHLLAHRATEDAALRYNQAREWLDNIAKRKIFLSSDSSSGNIPDKGLGISSKYDERIFPKEVLDRYRF